MTEKVDYEELLPHEFEERLAYRPVAYLPIGTLEWHGPQSALGADFIQSRGLFRRAAKRYGGIVMPPVWLAPDRITASVDGESLIGMDTSEYVKPHAKLPGSLYWISKGLFLTVIEAVLLQAKRAGFECVVAGGRRRRRSAAFECRFR